MYFQSFCQQSARYYYLCFTYKDKNTNTSQFALLSRWNLSCTPGWRASIFTEENHLHCMKQTNKQPKNFVVCESSKQKLRPQVMYIRVALENQASYCKIIQWLGFQVCNFIRTVSFCNMVGFISFNAGLWDNSTKKFGIVVRQTQARVTCCKSAYSAQGHTR